MPQTPAPKCLREAHDSDNLNSSTGAVSDIVSPSGSYVTFHDRTIDDTGLIHSPRHDDTVNNEFSEFNYCTAKDHAAITIDGTDPGAQNRKFQHTKSDLDLFAPPKETFSNIAGHAPHIEPAPKPSLHRQTSELPIVDKLGVHPRAGWWTHLGSWPMPWMWHRLNYTRLCFLVVRLSIWSLIFAALDFIKSTIDNTQALRDTALCTGAVTVFVSLLAIYAVRRNSFRIMLFCLFYMIARQGVYVFEIWFVATHWHEEHLNDPEDGDSHGGDQIEGPIIFITVRIPVVYCYLLYVWRLFEELHDPTSSVSIQRVVENEAEREYARRHNSTEWQTMEATLRKDRRMSAGDHRRRVVESIITGKMLRFIIEDGLPVKLADDLRTIEEDAIGITLRLEARKQCEFDRELSRVRSQLRQQALVDSWRCFEEDYLSVLERQRMEQSLKLSTVNGTRRIDGGSLESYAIVVRDYVKEQVQQQQPLEQLGGIEMYDKQVSGTGNGSGEANAETQDDDSTFTVTTSDGSASSSESIDTILLIDKEKQVEQG